MKGRGKLGGLPSKAKYYLVPDSEPVPRGKGEKNPGEGSEIEPETPDLQTAEGLPPFGEERPTACLLRNEPASCSQRWVKSLWDEAIGKPSPKGR